MSITKKTGNPMCTDSVKVGLTTDCDREPLPAIWIGEFLFRWKAPKEKCCMFGLMHLSVIFLPPKNGRHVKGKIGKITGKTKKPKCFSLSGKTTSCFIALFFRQCSPPKAVTSFHKMYLQTNF